MRYIWLDAGPEETKGKPLRVYCIISLWEKRLYLIDLQGGTSYHTGTSEIRKHYDIDSGGCDGIPCLYAEEEIYRTKGTVARDGLVWISIGMKHNPPKTGTIIETDETSMQNASLLSILEGIE